MVFIFHWQSIILLFKIALNSRKNPSSLKKKVSLIYVTLQYVKTKGDFELTLRLTHSFSSLGHCDCGILVLQNCRAV